MRNGFGFESCKSEVMQETRRGIFAPECFECVCLACMFPAVKMRIFVHDWTEACGRCLANEEL